MQHPKDASENAAPHLLIVDDDLDLCEVLTRYLEAEAFRVSSAQTGSEGSKAGIEGSYELIVLDVMLPDKKGFASGAITRRACSWCLALDGSRSASQRLKLSLL